MSAPATATATEAAPPRFSAAPPGLATFDAEAFRRKVAGFADPNRLADTPGETAAIKDDAMRFICVLAHLFGEDLDRTTLWARIDSALETALAKAGDGEGDGSSDLSRFAHSCLEHVQASAAQAAACEPLAGLLASWDAKPAEYGRAFLTRVRLHRLPLLVQSRSRWEQVKKGQVEL